MCAVSGACDPPDSMDHKILQILDNHESHSSVAAVDLAKRNGVVLSTISPHNQVSVRI